MTENHQSLSVISNTQYRLTLSGILGNESLICPDCRRAGNAADVNADLAGPRTGYVIVFSIVGVKSYGMCSVSIVYYLEGAVDQCRISVSLISVNCVEIPG